MTIATENVNEREIENGNQAEDQPSVNGSRNENVNENENGIVATKGVTLLIAQDIKGKRKKEENAEDYNICVCVCVRHKRNQ